MMSFFFATQFFYERKEKVLLMSKTAVFEHILTSFRNKILC